MGEERCAIPQKPVTLEASRWEREGLRRVRDRDFDPAEGYEWPGDEPEDGSDDARE